MIRRIFTFEHSVMSDLNEEGSRQLGKRDREVTTEEIEESENLSFLRMLLSLWRERMLHILITTNQAVLDK